MPKAKLTLIEINKIKNLRKTGHTLSEIKKFTGKSNGTIWKYIGDVSVLPEYQKIWEAKRGGSKAKSEREWKEAQNKASRVFKRIGFFEKMLILSCLYWGEGNKTELNLINSDPFMIRVILVCLRDLGIKNDELKISLRLFEDIDKRKAISYWSHILSLPKGAIQKVNIIPGKKIGKLEHGMCRVRVKRGGRYFKLIISMIDLIKLKV